MINYSDNGTKPENSFMTQQQNGTDRAVFVLSQAEIDQAIARGRRMRAETAIDLFTALGMAVESLLQRIAASQTGAFPRRPVPRVPGRGFGY